MFRHVSGITYPFPEGTTQTQILWLLCVVVDQRTSTTAHNSHQICIRVVPPGDGQVMPEHVETFKLSKV
jgi:hypothetical protein